VTANKRIQNTLPAVPAVAPSDKREDVDAVIETGIDGARRAGILIAVAVFGVFGLWATLAPLNGAAHAPGTVTVRSYRQVVQHLEGGMVSEINVQNGDFVEAGAPLLALDSTQSLAQLEIANAGFAALTTIEARLIAERDGLDSIVYPASLSAAGANAVEEMAVQTQIFEARKAAREGGIAVLEQRIEQLKSRVTGLGAMKLSKEELVASFADELADVRLLLEEGFADKIRLRELERNHSVLKGEGAELVATISSTEMQIGETQLQILQTNNEFQSEVVNQLGEVQTSLKDARERTTALHDVVNRTVVRAPVSGVVNSMQYHTIGAVIGPGNPIADIVPQSDELVVEARVSPMDIDRVTIGQEATIRFSAFSSSVPTIFGTVLGVSADAMVDQQTGMPYYMARVQVTPEGMTELGGLALVPGMPAEVFIASGSRTFFQYVMKPFSNALARSLIED
jgi:epimerase transport system membrane fusion protein